MEFAETVRRRRMVRRFTAGPVPDDALRAVLEAGLRAPSAGHTQAVEFAVCLGGAVDDFWSLTAHQGETTNTGSSAWLDGLRTAPVLVEVWTTKSAYRARYAEPDKARAELVAPWWWVDAGMAVEAMLLAAVDQGLGACFFGLPPGREDALRAAAGLPADRTAVGVLALGHAHPDAAPGRSSSRPRRSDRVHFLTGSQENCGNGGPDVTIP